MSGKWIIRTTVFASFGLVLASLAQAAGTTERVSVASDGTQANDVSGEWADISGNGRYIVFTSQANNLVADDTNGTWDVFVFDRDTEKH